MSQPQQQQATVDPTAVLQQLASMERYLNNLQKLIESVGNSLADARVARQALERLKQGPEGEVLVATDRTGNVLLKSRLSPEDPIVHLGLDVYAQIPLEKALEILSRREKAVEAQLNQLQKELADKAKEFQRLQQLAAALSQQAQQAQQAQGPGAAPAQG